MQDLFADFSTVDVQLDQTTMHARVGGSGPPVLLLHGYPQTHVIWHEIAGSLASQHTTIAADLRGYGDSHTSSEDFTFRAMATEQVQLMSALGHERFHVVGHDRGARVAHRMALDQPWRVASVTLLDILPTLQVWQLMNAWLAQRYYHWVFLAQDEFPARLISRDPVYFLRQTLGGLSGPLGLDLFDSRALTEYERAARRPEVVTAWCKDYWFAARDDLEHDRTDLERRLEVPALVLWGDRGVVGAQCDPLEVWRRHFTHVVGSALDAGHFLPEERPREVLAAVSDHLRTTGGA